MSVSLPVISNCDDCGACCMGQAGLPASWFVSPVIPSGRTASGKSLPNELRKQLQAIVQQWLNSGFPADDSPCIWFDQKSRRCRHYEYRPDLCRDAVIPGDAACRRWREKFEIDAGKGAT